MENIICSIHDVSNEALIPKSARIICEKLTITRGVVIGENVSIKAREVYIGDQSFIGDFTNIHLGGDLHIGEYTKIHKYGLLNGKKSINIGHNCWIGQNCILNGEENLMIGNNVGIGTYSSIWTHGYFGELIEGCNYYSVKPTIIEDDVWLVGSYNTVFPGVKIGKKAVIMGTSVITKNIESGKTFSGNPAIDITDKIKQPYIPITLDEKKYIIKAYLTKYFTENKYNFTELIDEIQVDGLGIIKFKYDENYSKNESVAIFDNIPTFMNVEATLFCLESKRYNKKNSKLEIMLRKILNSVVARFLPLS
ncbi:MAG: acyltransferase [Raineya sp.]|jgi:acetyltransferase-like isoleucine patch superfamily enzyme|nr:acyltransferase [Raineya sp.]